MFCSTKKYFVNNIFQEKYGRTILALYMPSYLLPSSGAYLLILRPFELRTTLTGFPALQFLDSAPFLSSNGASQFRARALKNIFLKVFQHDRVFLKVSAHQSG